MTLTQAYAKYTKALGAYNADPTTRRFNAYTKAKTELHTVRREVRALRGAPVQGEARPPTIQATMKEK